MDKGGWRALLHTIHTFVPCVLVTSVFPIARCEKVLGAFTSYQSFLENGSTLHCVGKGQPAVRHDKSDVRWDIVLFRAGDLHLLLSTFLALADPLVLPDRHPGQQVAATI